jgi:hypothetical protein
MLPRARGFLLPAVSLVYVGVTASLLGTGLLPWAFSAALLLFAAWAYRRTDGMAEDARSVSRATAWGLRPNPRSREAPALLEQREVLVERGLPPGLGVAGPERLDDHQPPAGTHDAAHLLDRAGDFIPPSLGHPIPEVAEDPARDGEVGGRLGQRERARVRLVHAILRTDGVEPPASDREHRRRTIDEHKVLHAPREQARDAARAGPDVDERRAVERRALLQLAHERAVGVLGGDQDVVVLGPLEVDPCLFVASVSHRGEA